MLIVLRLPNIIFLFKFLRSKVFTTASVPPYRGQKPQKEGCNRPTRYSEPLRSWVGGPIRGLRQILRDGTAGGGGLFADCPRLTSSSLLFRSALVDTRMRKIVFVNLYLVYD